MSIEIFMTYDEKFDENKINEICETHQRITSITITKAYKNKIEYCTNIKTPIFYTDREVDYKNHCGIISKDYFSINFSTFTEAQKHNTCLNRKISIDVNGNIKNCPSMTKNYGNIKDTTLQEAIEKPGFKDLWYIHKDQIKVCQDCEFRYICTDCRAFIENPEDIYSKPAKCHYDPYTATWADIPEEAQTNSLHGT